ncbi:2-nitropropane dioxygenase-like enzyme [Mycobacteroides abscessus subsp. bolletii]|nr:2-nitropropane dioxygenase-like enzyme [Mycobacteroides abscessus]SHQ72785.1 2-nitropropane dioxygenase-like enzyme [Mycobacteroides abscessus subsp. bolletii]SHS57448.1 2-nitropropane dioxygenase-like enzyme [Mycobacteroides abscessus subsp. bolletii]SHS91708.1 2-nitropropane dioxygenase-like enzyme [Mycobacteroides abscessus subsp. bolletii]SHT18128.1 2-nitropropane dioxygenase-like enzyme [Mycobacteroides abscessus subsp. bolletii]
MTEWFDGPLLLSGAIAHGASILAALAAGADFAYVGSAFISTAEANATPEYKQMIVDSAATDIVYSNLFTGVHGNYLRGSSAAAGLDPDNLPASDPSAMNFGSGGNMKIKAWKDIWASGQGVGAVKESTTVAELVGQLKDQFDDACQALDTNLAARGLSPAY